MVFETERDPGILKEWRGFFQCCDQPIPHLLFIRAFGAAAFGGADLCRAQGLGKLHVMFDERHGIGPALVDDDRFKPGGRIRETQSAIDFEELISNYVFGKI